jgi:hypothetical protein
MTGMMTGGSGLSERERGELGWVSSGQIWAGWSPGVGPVGLLTSLFFLPSFSFVLNFCFEF